MKKIHIFIYFLVTFVLLVAIILSDYFLWGLGFKVGNITISEKVSVVIYFLTLCAIIWYAKETQELKEVSVKRPCLSFNRDTEIKLKNYGEGVARDIEIKIGGETVHKIPLMSSIYSSSSSPLKISGEAKKLLEEWKNEIVIRYYDIGGKTQYTTKIKWDDSVNNRDRCEIIYYGWK